MLSPITMATNTVVLLNFLFVRVTLFVFLFSFSRSGVAFHCFVIYLSLTAPRVYWIWTFPPNFVPNNKLLVHLIIIWLDDNRIDKWLASISIKVKRFSANFSLWIKELKSHGLKKQSELERCRCVVAWIAYLHREKFVFFSVRLVRLSMFVPIHNNGVFLSLFEGVPCVPVSFPRNQCLISAKEFPTFFRVCIGL